MNILSLLIFGVLGIILGGVFSAQTKDSKPLDILLIVAILGGLILSVSLFPLGLVGLFGGAIVNWLISDDATPLD